MEEFGSVWDGIDGRWEGKTNRAKIVVREFAVCESDEEGGEMAVIGDIVEGGWDVIGMEVRA